MIRSISVAAFLVVFSTGATFARQSYSSFRFVPSELTYIQDTVDAETETFPEPKKVLYQSLLIPGWGQVTNNQTWKVPIVYGLIGGLTYYSIYLHKRYHDYRAAYYNSVYGEDSDFRFGPTPSYISANANQTSLRTNRNFYRNRRDFVYVTIGLAYALNAIDAYVFAHLRNFDVSDDLSMNARLKPGVITTSISEPIPSVRISLRLTNK